MICIQLKIYVIYLIIQTLFAVFFFGFDINLISIIIPILFISIIYLLCHFKYDPIANVLIGITIISGIALDIYSLTHRKFANVERQRLADIAHIERNFEYRAFH